MSTRKKPPIAVRAPSKADDFVAGGQPASAQPASAQPASAQAAERHTPTPTPVTSGGPRRRGIVARADGSERYRLTAYVDSDIGAKLRRFCFENEIDISDKVAEIVTKAVNELPVLQG